MLETSRPSSIPVAVCLLSLVNGCCSVTNWILTLSSRYPSKNGTSPDVFTSMIKKDAWSTHAFNFLFRYSALILIKFLRIVGRKHTNFVSKTIKYWLAIFITLFTKNILKYYKQSVRPLRKCLLIKEALVYWKNINT